MRLAPSNPITRPSQTVHCSAPAKLILSGEHAVLFGCPALSMAIDLNTHCTLSTQPHTQSQTQKTSDNQSAHFHIQLNDFQLEASFNFADWQHQASQIEQRFKAFKANRLAIDNVLCTPFDLVLISLWVFNQTHPIQPQNWHIRIHSEVPIGRGLGSSAGVIVSLLAGLFKAHQHPVLNETLLDLAKQIESYQHGQSSGLDPATLIQAGLLKYQLNQPIKTLPSQPLNAWLIDTGAPLSHTGECVHAVKQHHQNDTALWQAFKKVSLEIEQAWLTHDTKQLKQAIQANQQLLQKIGVVPKPVEQFIQQLDHTLNAASKVCGAGSIAGDNAGMVLCLSDIAPTELCAQYRFAYWPLKLQTQGVHCVLD